MDKLAKSQSVRKIKGPAAAGALQRAASTLSISSPDVSGFADNAPGAVDQSGSNLSADASSATGAASHYKGSVAKQAHTSFLTLLSETEKQSRYKTIIAEKLVNDIADVIKSFQRDKAIEDKKQVDFGVHYQETLSKVYQELLDWSQLYEKVQKESEAARQKYEDAIKPKKGALAALSNMVMGDNQERIERLRQKSKSSSRRLDEVRNEYLLALDAANAVQNHYYTQELPSIMKRLDGSFYPTFVQLLSVYSSMENDFAIGLRASTEAWTIQTLKVEREKELAKFIAEVKPLFDIPPTISFQRAGNDEKTNIVLDEFTRIILAKKLGSLVTKQSELEKEINRKTKELAGLEQMVLVYSKTPEFGDAKNPIIGKIDLEHQIDLLTVEFTRLSAVISTLKNAGVAPMSSVDDRKSSGTRSVNQVTAIFDYSANDQSELSFKAGDIIEVTYVDASGNDNGSNMWWEGLHIKSGKTGNFAVQFTEGWQEILAAKGNRITDTKQLGQQGSQGSVAVTGRPAAGATNLGSVRALYAYKASCDGELTFSVGQIIVVTNKSTGSDAWWEGYLPDGSSGQFPVNYVEVIEVDTNVPQDVHPALSSRNNSKAASQEVFASSTSGERRVVKALYDYAGGTAEELTFAAGDVITVLREGVEEGWNEGQLVDGTIGIYPINYVSNA